MADTRKLFHRYINQDLFHTQQNKIVYKNEVNSPYIDESINLSMYQMLGQHLKEQMDNLIAFCPKEITATTTEGKKINLTVAEKSECLKRAISHLNDSINTEDIGSTLNGTIAWKNGNVVKTLTANVGNSLSFLIITHQNKVRDFKLLNRTHVIKNLTNNDVISVGALGSTIDKKKQSITNIQNQTFTITHAIGFKGSLPHDANCFESTVKLSEDERAFIFNTTDSANAKLFTKELITQLIEANKGNVSRTAGALKNRTIAETENFSFTLFKISKKPTAAFVFSGLKSNKISNFLAENFYDAYAKELKSAMELKTKIPTVMQLIQHSSNILTGIKAYQDKLNFLDKLVLRRHSTKAINDFWKIIKKINIVNYQQAPRQIQDVIDTLEKNGNSKNLIPLLENFKSSLEYAFSDIDKYIQEMTVEYNKEIVEDKEIFEDEEFVYLKK